MNHVIQWLDIPENLIVAASVLIVAGFTWPSFIGFRQSKLIYDESEELPLDQAKINLV